MALEQIANGDVYVKGVTNTHSVYEFTNFLANGTMQQYTGYVHVIAATFNLDWFFNAFGAVN